MQPQDIYAAWKRKDIDAAYIWQPIQTKLINSGGKMITNSKLLAKEGIITGEFGIVSNTFAAHYPNVIRAYVKILNQSVHYYENHPEKSAQLLSKELGLSPEESLKTMKQIIWLDEAKQKEYFGSAGRTGKLASILKDTADYMVQQKNIPSAPDLKTYQKALYTNLYQ